MLNELIFTETSHSKKEIINLLETSLSDIEKAKEITLTDDQKERFAELEKVIPKALTKAKKLTKETTLHKIVNTSR